MAGYRKLLKIKLPQSLTDHGHKPRESHKKKIHQCFLDSNNAVTLIEQLP